MQLRYNKQAIKAVIDLPGSKSISNRLLILNEVLNAGLQIQNLSPAKDTQDLVKAIDQIRNNKNPDGGSNMIDIGHAGTDMRFLTALLSIKKGDWILTGSERMKERPISELVNALRKLGAEIDYSEKEGFPPLKIKGKKLEGGKIEIDGSISSQFISALLLIAPSFEKGLEIKIKNEIVSWPYVLMTLDLLKEFGIEASKILNTIIVKFSKSEIGGVTSPSRAEPRDLNLKSYFAVESDWSAASYWYSIVALSKNAEITLKGLGRKSSQGDAICWEIYKQFGVDSVFKDGNVILKNTGNAVSDFEYDFSDCPDLAQTVAVTCLALNINCMMKGLSTLKHKETHRIVALKNELQKFGVEVTITDNSLEFRKQVSGSKLLTSDFKLLTYGDHRMAMSFAPLALIYDQIIIEDPEVVQKSYPAFWEHLKMVGIGSE